MVVAVTMEGSTFQAGNPTMLFELEARRQDFWGYDIAPDGKRFVWIKDDAPQGEEEADHSHLRFIFNWFDDVKARVPTAGN